MMPREVNRRVAFPDTPVHPLWFSPSSAGGREEAEVSKVRGGGEGIDVEGEGDARRSRK